ncbi:hypothetical protein NQ314_010657 [Rhamnusium bicolor]|uniref:Uncharacterized protein n=1 Tax=Rhamnusium bicolor TaxID=1586634 RepID=A0AAV8XP57_9CUCU|nr:hypothetical protein NQ314_010657 [Rhamnusium bicolor]
MSKIDSTCCPNKEISNKESAKPVDYEVIYNEKRHNNIKNDKENRNVKSYVPQPSTSNEYKEESNISSDLDSTQERIAEEMENYLEDSDCSVRDKDYVPEPESSDTGKFTI